MHYMSYIPDYLFKIRLTSAIQAVSYLRYTVTILGNVHTGIIQSPSGILERKCGYSKLIFKGIG